MDQLRDLLGEAVARGAPSKDALIEVRKRAHRHARLRRGMTAAVALTLSFATAFLVWQGFSGLSRTSRLGDRAQVTLNPHVASNVDLGIAGQISSIEFGSGSLWVSGFNDKGEFVLRVRPDGQVTDSLAVSAPHWEVGGGGISSDEDWVWIAGSDDGRAVLQQIDPSESRIVRVVDLNAARAEDVEASGSDVWVLVGDGMNANAAVVKLDAGTGRIVDRIPLEPEIVVRRLGTANGVVWVAGNESNPDGLIGDTTLTLIDMANDQVLHQSVVDYVVVATAKDDNHLWAVNSTNSFGSLVEANAKSGEVEASFPISTGDRLASQLVIDELGGVWFVTSSDFGSTISRLDPTNGRTTFSTHAADGVIAMTAGQESVWYVSSHGTLTRIDLE